MRTPRTPLTLALFTLVSCGGDPPARPLPAGMLMGAATAGYQVDMGCPTLPASVCADPNTDWYQYSVSPQVQALGHTYLAGQDPAVVGPGHWELFAQDFDLAVAEGHTGFRMSLEWSRIFPTSTVGLDGFAALHAHANPDALAHYHAVFAALKARGLTPYVTINHYTLPSWIHDGAGCTLDYAHCTARGWDDPATTIPEITKYAGFVAQEFGGEVDRWATENEPFALVLPGYLMPSESRSNPPAQSLDAASAKRVFNALITAHARMYDAVHAADTVDADGDGVAADVGLVFAMVPVVAKDPTNPADALAAKNVFYLYNMAFLNAVAGGVLDEDLTGVGVPHPELAHRMDHLGINYYVRATVEGADGPVLPDLSPLTTFNPFRVSQDEVYPRGVYELMTLVHTQFGVPVVISENNGGGLPALDYAKEEKNLTEEFQWMLRAVDEGVPLKGYYYWTLMDNVEWNHGVMKYGLYAVDPADPTKARVRRPHADLLKRFATERRIPGDLIAKYPISE